MTANLLEMQGIIKTFPGVVANDNVDFTLQRGEIHGLLGENGAGKSTLMNVLYGLYGLDSGKILLNGKVVEIRTPLEAISLGIGMVHQEFMLVEPFTVAENVALGLDIGDGPLLAIDEVRERIREISEKYGLAVDPDARIEHLSVGVQQRVEIIKLLVRDVNLLILDEPTAVLVPQEIDGLFSILRLLVKDGRSVVFITHKLNEIMAISDRVSVLRDGKMVATMPTVDIDMNELARMMVGREVLFRIRREQHQAGSTVFEAQDINANTDNDTPALRGVSFEIHEGEILGVAGVDGNGQTELAEVLTGLRSAQEGKILLDGQDVTSNSTAEFHNIGLAYIPADRHGEGSIGSLEIADNCILGRLDEFEKFHIFLDEGRIRQHAENIVGDYDVRTPNVNIVARKLSGGNLQKLVVGRELSRNPRVLIVEQPTRGLDVGAIEYVQGQLLAARNNGAAILLISTELDEILSLSDRIIVLYEGSIMGCIQADRVDVEILGLMMTGIPEEKALSGRKGTANTT